MNNKAPCAGTTGRGRGVEEALLDAGILRLRPVLITVGVTVFALVPLVPVFYSISVLDLKIIKWEVGQH